MTDWTSMLHSLAGALLGAGAALTGQLIVAKNTRIATRDAAQNDHQKWARDLAAQAHDGFIVEFERLTPFYAPLDQPLEEDWLTGVHLKLQRMRLVCSTDSYRLAHRAMQALEIYRTTPAIPWDPAQAAFDAYLASARRDLGLVPQHEPDPLHKRILEHAHIYDHVHAHRPEHALEQTVTNVDVQSVDVPPAAATVAIAADAVPAAKAASGGDDSPPIPIAISEPLPVALAPVPYAADHEPYLAILAPQPLGPAPAKAKVTYSYPEPTSAVGFSQPAVPTGSAVASQ